MLHGKIPVSISMASNCPEGLESIIVEAPSKSKDHIAPINSKLDKK
jgi:hypothetical protein